MKKLLLATLSCCAMDSYGQNLIDNYLSGNPTYTVIANSNNSINQPRDLDFKPHTNELWVANKGTSNGGSVVIIYNAGESNQVAQLRKDSHSSHFMPYPSAIAFGDDGEWAGTNEIMNTAGPGSTFMGPALWSSDTSIFARVFQNPWAGVQPLGSHLDMLHQSPFAMGIAHETGSAYWVFDGHNGNLCKYDFGEDHSPGYDDHSNGKIWRYSDVSLTRTADVPAHMILDKPTGWLYIVDAGTKYLKRVDINSGTNSGTLTPPASGSEMLNGYWNMTGATVEVLDSFFTSQPSGIDLYNNRLIVGDYNTGDIHVYDVSSGTPIKLGTLATGQSGMMGLKIGTDGKIWFVNNTQNTVVRIDPTTGPTDDVEITAITAPLVNNFESHFYNTAFNQCNGSITPEVTIRNNGTNTLTNVEIMYYVDGGMPVVQNWTGSLATGASASVTLPLSTVTTGVHKLTVEALAPNGVSDLVRANNTKWGSFRTIDTIVGFPYMELFAAPAFPAAGWSYIAHNFNNEMSHDASVSGFGIGSGSIKMNNFDGFTDIAGQKDYLIMPRVNMSAAGANANLSFSVAYSQYEAISDDRLAVLVSTDCGATWTQVFDKGGSDLATTSSFNTNAFSPNATQWRTETVMLGSYTSQPEIMIMFRATSGWGNNLFLDDISLSNTLDVATHAKPQFSVYPNPAKDRFTVAGLTKDATIQIYDIAGKLVKSISHTGSGSSTIDMSQQANGTYLISIVSGSEAYHERLTVAR